MVFEGSLRLWPSPPGSPNSLNDEKAPETSGVLPAPNGVDDLGSHERTRHQSIFRAAAPKATSLAASFTMVRSMEDHPITADVHRHSRRSSFTLRYPPNNAWPALMRADMAAAYVDARSVAAFLRGVGAIYPKPIRGAGRRGVWTRASLGTDGAGIDSDDLAELI